jgi:TetR/AcrR family transcriptional repressor of nem operon
MLNDETSARQGRRGPKPNPETRDNLIRAGVRLFHQAGYGATGVKDVVDAAQVPKGSFYNHFESKEAFGAEVIDSYFGSGLPDLRSMLTNAEVPPVQRLRSFFENRAAAFRRAGFVRGCMLGNFSLEVADHSPQIRERVAAHFRTWSRLFEDCIAEAQKSGAVKSALPASVLAQFLLDGWEGALLRMRADQSQEPLARFIEVVFNSLLA